MTSKYNEEVDVSLRFVYRHALSISGLPHGYWHARIRSNQLRHQW